jgi:hypothetical protein
MKYKIIATLMVLPLAACSGNSLLPSQRDRFEVESTPTGASVRLLGEIVGKTPMSLNTRAVFPQNFPYDKQHLYGRIELSYPGCEPFSTTVSSRIISEGLKARLKCNDSHQLTPQTVAPVATPRTEQGELKHRLLQLKELYEEGLISEQDYVEKRRQLLEEL